MCLCRSETVSYTHLDVYKRQLQEIAAATSKVMRGGKMEVKKSEELVPGDIVILEAGDACLLYTSDEDDLLGEEKTETKGSEKEVLGDQVEAAMERLVSDTVGHIPKIGRAHV